MENSDLLEKVSEFEPRLQLERTAGHIRSVDLNHPFLQMFSDPSSLFRSFSN